MEIEQPFGTNISDLPLDLYCQRLDGHLRQVRLQSEENLGHRKLIGSCARWRPLGHKLGAFY